MKNTKKMILVPLQDGGGDGDDLFAGDSGHDDLTGDTEATPSKKKGNRIRKYAADRQRKMLTVVLKLALSNGYDELGMMQTMDGESLDIIPLLIYSLSPGKNITGLADFVRLLSEAGVVPDDVINSHVKDMLARFRAGPRYKYTRQGGHKKPPGTPPPARKGPSRGDTPPPRLEGPFHPREVNDEPNPPPQNTHQLPEQKDEIMDSRSKRLIGEVDSDSDDEDKKSGKRDKNPYKEPDWDARDSDLDTDKEDNDL